MDLNALKLQHIGLDLNEYGKIYTFVDFGNVNKWFDEEVWDWDENKLQDDEKLFVDIEKLAKFIDIFSSKKFFYYGFDKDKPASLHINVKARKQKFRVVSKPIQWIKHYFTPSDKKAYRTVFKQKTKKDQKGIYLNIPKCNFDVELCLNVVRLKDHYDTICIFTSDNDFSILLEYLRKQKKKVILISSNPIRKTLKEKAHLFINVQKAKGYICGIKKSKKK